MTAYRGTPVSEGAAVGELYLPDIAVPGSAAPGSAAPDSAAPDSAAPDSAAGTGTVAVTVTVTADDVRAAFATVAAERHALAGRLRAAGRDHEADIVAIGALIAADPALSGPALAALDQSAPDCMGTARPVPLASAAAAIAAAGEEQAAILAALPDPDLAQRAGDVRQVAGAVAARLAGAQAGDTAPPPPGGPFILVRREVDPADLIRLADGANLVGAVSVGGGASSHAAIIARGLGLPMLAGADPAVVTVPAGQIAILDTAAGELLVGPTALEVAAAELGAAERAAAERAGIERAAAELAGLPGVLANGSVRTTDGELVTILCNVASAAETRLGLANGAAGVGLLRTEIPFTHASGWPSRGQHLAALAPVLRLLAGRRAVVRLLDFAGDKVPPFPGAAGLTAFLHAPGALAAQLTAILDAGAGTDLAIMIPMVRSHGEVERVRAELAKAAKAAGVDAPPLGMMVELAGTARAASAFAGGVDFFSIGTNDLTADVLGRERSALRPADAAQPPVLAVIAHVVQVARDAGIGLSVCGDAAADPAVLPALLAIGVRTVSVGAAKVTAVARWIGETNAG
jgi:phosphoenolpyruvate-protein kinase (PTS system EI component)